MMFLIQLGLKAVGGGFWSCKMNQDWYCQNLLPMKFSIDIKILTLQNVHPSLVLFPSRPFNFIRFLVKFVGPRFSLYLLSIQIHIANLSSKVWFLPSNLFKYAAHFYHWRQPIVQLTIFLSWCWVRLQSLYTLYRPRCWSDSQQLQSKNLSW